MLSAYARTGSPSAKYELRRASQAAQAHYMWVRVSEVIWTEYTRIISVLSDAKKMQKS